MVSFSDLGILPVLELAVAIGKITEPTTIQSKAIPTVLAGKNAYISSETGTGKTLAYLLPLLSQIDHQQPVLQTIVVAPTHELAMQICKIADILTQNSGLEIRLQVLIGGVSTKRQLQKLKSKPHIVIGTPGRIHELIVLRKIKPHTVKSIIIDEVDRLLFGDTLVEIQKIIKSTLRGRQLVFVSATKNVENSQETETLAPGLIQIHAGCNQINTTIEHFYIECQERDKPEILRKLLRALRPDRAIVFVHRNATIKPIIAKLTHHKIAAVDLQGTQDSVKRKKAIDSFRNAMPNILVASDIAARGLDIAGVSFVFNFDLPSQSKDYLHRVGRTSRAGSGGRAISLVTAQEHRLIKRYQTELDITIRAGRLKSGVFSVVE